MKRLPLPLAILTTITGGAFLLTTGASNAATMNIPVPLAIVDAAPQGIGEPGGTYPIGTVANGAAAGRVCTVSISNNESVRQGSDVTFTSGSHSLTLFNVEGSTPRTTSGQLTLEGLTTVVTVTIHSQNDPQFSGSDGLMVCPDVPTTTLPPTTTVPPTTQPPVTTVPPVSVVRPPADVIVAPAKFTG